MYRGNRVCSLLAKTNVDQANNNDVQEHCARSHNVTISSFRLGRSKSSEITKMDLARVIVRIENRMGQVGQESL